MPTQLALSNLRHNRARTALSIAGVGFAIVLMFLQLGFLGGVSTTATRVYQRLEYDAVIRSPDYLHLCDARAIPRDWLNAVASMPEVASVKPFHVMLGIWQRPEVAAGAGRPDHAPESHAAESLSSENHAENRAAGRKADDFNAAGEAEGDRAQAGKSFGIIVMGMNPQDDFFDVPDIRRQRGRLTSPSFVLIDRKTHRDFGPVDGERFGDGDIDQVTDILQKQVQIVGHFELGTGLAANGAVLTSEAGFERLSPVDAVNYVSMGLIRLREPREAERFCREATERLGGDSVVNVLTRREVERRELDRWIKQTPVGVIFKTGVAISFLVGAAIVYMVLSTDVANHLGEYATLNAMGYPQRYLNKVIMQQAMLLAVLAFVPAWAVSEVLYVVTARMANMEIEMTLPRLALVLGLSVLMCAVSGLLAVRKLRQADPADLF